MYNNSYQSLRKGLVATVFSLIMVGLSATVAAEGQREIKVNGKTLTVQQQRYWSSVVGASIPPGSYWYDKRSGAWGYWCGPVSGIIQPGLTAATLPKGASCGQTGVIINGREIQYNEYSQLSMLIGSTIQPGRYWLDANGNAGDEGGPAEVNLRQLYARQQQNNVYRYKSDTANGVFSSGCSGMTVKQADGSSASAYVGCD